MSKLKRNSTKIALAIIGAFYLAALSNLELNMFVKGYVAIAPFQLLALVFGLYTIYIQKFRGGQHPPN